MWQKPKSQIVHVPRRKNELKVNPNDWCLLQKEFFAGLDYILFNDHDPIEYGLIEGSKRQTPSHDHVGMDHSLGWGGYEFDLTTPFKMRVLIEHQGGDSYRIRYQVPDLYTKHTMLETMCVWEEIPTKLIGGWALVQKMNESQIKREIKERFLRAQRTGK